jgi:hypothetical protein
MASVTMILLTLMMDIEMLFGTKAKKDMANYGM